ncbi:MAG: WG repeat-containing protein [Prevotella sp.]|nr:WG repeat-containing protein [Prevotella sp.]
MKKRLLLLTTFLVSTMILVGQVRTENEIKKMLKHGKQCSKTLLYDDASQWNKMALTKEVSLKTQIKGYETNRIEQILLENFDDVRISEGLPNAYFVFVGSSIGLYSLEGNIILPPIEGLPRTISSTKRLYWGDTRSMGDWNTYIINARGKARRAYAGNFAAVLDRQTLEPVIPFGKYDEIHWTMKGLSTYYYVSKIKEGELKWGVCDKTGKEIVPCEYNYVGLKNGEFIGDNTKNMEREMVILNNILRRREYNRTHKLENMGKLLATVANAIGDAAVVVGDAIVAVDDVMQKSGTYDAINSLAAYYGSTSDYSNTSYRSGASEKSVSNNITGNTMSGSDQQNYNVMRNTYRKWANDLQQMKYSNGKYQNGYTQSDKHHAQSEMKRIRNTAKSKWGKEIPYDALEDW